MTARSRSLWKAPELGNCYHYWCFGKHPLWLVEWFCVPRVTYVSGIQQGLMWQINYTSAHLFIQAFLDSVIVTLNYWTNLKLASLPVSFVCPSWSWRQKLSSLSLRGLLGEDRKLIPNLVKSRNRLFFVAALGRQTYDSFEEAQTLVF